MMSMGVEAPVTIISPGLSWYHPARLRSPEVEMRDSWLSLVVLVTWIVPPVQGEHPQATPPRVFQFDGRRIAEVRRRIDKGDPRRAEALKRLRDRADRELRTPMLSVVEKPQTLPSGDKHDYLS